MPQFVENVEEIRQRAIRKIEEGAVTSSYGLDKDQAISILNEALATEIVCVLRYMHHYFMATGVHGSAARDEFKEHADAEREHADRLGERIQQLGGVPDFNPGSLVQRSVSQYIEGENLADMIREDLIAERVVIDVYREMIRFFGDKDPTTRVLIEDILKDEEEHANDLTDLLYVVNPQTGETEGEDPGTEIYGGSRQNSTSRGSQAPSEAAATQQRQQPPQSGQRARPAARQKQTQTGNQQSGQRSQQQVQPEHQPGTTGRTMNRRGRNEIDTEDELAAPGGQSGGTRSETVTRPNRKKRVA